MGELATNGDISMGENDWGMISKNPPMYESGVDNAVIEVIDTENKVHKITFKKGGVLNLGREGKTLFLAWDDSDTINFEITINKKNYRVRILVPLAELIFSPFV